MNLLLTGLGALALAATHYQIQSIDTTVSSGGVAIPVTYVHPIVTDDETFPLVVIAHGHGGSRNESGSFTRVAEELAARGVASIRMDFPGCGDSSESFAKNNLTNMLQDIQASRDFAIAQPRVDSERVGLFGWSMGGRLALMLSGRDDTYKVIATWAPDASNGEVNMVNFVGGRKAYDELREQAAKEVLRRSRPTGDRIRNWGCSGSRTWKRVNRSMRCANSKVHCSCSTATSMTSCRPASLKH